MPSRCRMLTRFLAIPDDPNQLAMMRSGGGRDMATVRPQVPTPQRRRIHRGRPLLPASPTEAPLQWDWKRAGCTLKRAVQ